MPKPIEEKIKKLRKQFNSFKNNVVPHGQSEVREGQYLGIFEMYGHDMTSLEQCIQELEEEIQSPMEVHIVFRQHNAKDDQGTTIPADKPVTVCISKKVAQDTIKKLKESPSEPQKYHYTSYDVKS